MAVQAAESPDRDSMSSLKDDWLRFATGALPDSRFGVDFRASPHTAVRPWTGVARVFRHERVGHRLRLREQAEVTFVCLDAGRTVPGRRDPPRLVGRVDVSAEVCAVFSAPPMERHFSILPKPRVAVPVGGEDRASPTFDGVNLIIMYDIFG